MCIRDSANVVHVDGSVDPLRDIDVINLELVFADLETVDKRIQKSEKMIKTGDKRYAFEVEVFNKVKTTLESGKGVRTMELSDEEREVVEEACFLTAKPVLYAANLSEDEIADEANNDFVKKVRILAAAEGAEAVSYTHLDVYKRQHQCPRSPRSYGRD